MTSSGLTFSLNSNAHACGVDDDACSARTPVPGMGKF
jgi:hypothetical protein